MKTKFRKTQRLESHEKRVILCLTCYQTFAMTTWLKKTYSEKAIKLFEIIIGKYSEIGSKWALTFMKHDVF